MASFTKKNPLQTRGRLRPQTLQLFNKESDLGKNWQVLRPMFPFHVSDSFKSSRILQAW